MITDSYLNYNDTSTSSRTNNATGATTMSKYFSSSNNTANKPPLPANNNFSSLMEPAPMNGGYETRRRVYSDEMIIDILKGNNYKQQADVFEELITLGQAISTEKLIDLKNLDEFLNAVGYLLANTINNEIQRLCLRFLQVYFKSLDKLSASSPKSNANSTPGAKYFRSSDIKINECLLSYLIECSASNKVTLKKFSIDLIFSYMKLTEDLASCFSQFIKYGIEARPSQDGTDIAKQFIESSLYILINEEIANRDFFPLVRGLIKQLMANPKHEVVAFRCLDKIESVVKKDRFNDYLNKLPQNLKSAYFNKKANGTSNSNSNQTSNSSSSTTTTTSSSNSSLKFSLIPNQIVQKLSGEDETQRLAAINQLDELVLRMTTNTTGGIQRTMPREHQLEFIVYMSSFVDDANYEIRLGALKILAQFVSRLEPPGVVHSYKAICACVRQVLSQSHHSKTIKQSLNSIVINTVRGLQQHQPVLVVEALLEKIRDRSAKAREEFLNVITVAVIRFPNERCDSLRKVFFQIVPLMCDIKRNVRYAALECLAVIYSRLKSVDRNANTLLDQLEHLPEFYQSTTSFSTSTLPATTAATLDNVPLIREIIACRLNRGKTATLNSDLTLEYGLKLPQTVVGVTNGADLDIEWIVSGSSSASSATNLSSARSQPPPQSSSSLHRSINNSLFGNENVLNGPTPFSRREKRLPWDEDFNSVGGSKVMRPGRDGAAPLKAFPLNDDNSNDFLNSNSNISFTANNKTGYPASTSYQEKYLKKIQTDSAGRSSNKNDSFFDVNDAFSEARKLHNEKAYSLENLYNTDENSPNGNNVNSESSVQKRKYAHLNLKNTGSIIPSKPVIARRNSAASNRHNGNNSNNHHNNINHNIDPLLLDSTSTSSISRGYGLTNNTNSNNNDLIDYELANSIDYSENLFDTDRSGGKYDTVPNIRNSAKNRRKLEKIFSISSNNKKSSDESNSNSYLSKLRADKQSNSESTTARNYSPSNPESGFFSISDVDYGENNRFIKQHQQQQLKNASKSQPQGQQSTSNLINGGSNSNNNNNLEYNPLAGVSFKQTHASDVEIVGVRLAAQNNEPNINAKKKNSLKNLNENMQFATEYDTNMNGGRGGEGLDIIGRGYGNNNDYDYDFEPSPEETDFPLSLSLKSRLREEKNKKRVERLRQTGSGNSNNQYNDYDKNDFGLSISGYPNQSNSSLSSKPPIYNNNNNYDPPPQPLNPYEEFNERKIKPANPNNEFSMYPDEYPTTTTMGNGTSNVDKPKFQPTKATMNRLKAKAIEAAGPAASPSIDSPNGKKDIAAEFKRANSRENETADIYGPVKDEFVRQPFKNAEQALKDGLNLLAQEDWEKKCHGMNIIRRLSLYHQDLTVSNIHAIVLALLPEVRNLRSQVSRFALMTFGDLFVNLKKYMDVELESAVKTILHKNGESNDFIRSDVEKCLEKMIINCTATKSLIALINGGAAHRSPTVRRTAAQYIYKCSEVMGPGKILSGIKDVTEKILATCAQFVVDGPPDIRWYGRKIFHMLMSHDEFDRMLVKYLNEATRKNIKEILDSIRVKGPGEVPTESARNSRKGVRQGSETISRSAGSNSTQQTNGGSSIMSSRYMGSTATTDQEQNNGTMNGQPPVRSYQVGGGQTAAPPPPPPPGRMDSQSQEYMRNLITQMRNSNFKERIDAIEKFQVVCETETQLAVANLVPLFDRFNSCLTESNSKVNYKALCTMCQITPIMRDDLNPVLANTVPLIAQHLASKNSEIQDMASNVLDVMVEYLEGGVLIQPFTNLALHGNARIKPQIIFKLADLIPNVYSRKQKQIELHVLPALWQLLNSIKGNTGGNIQNASISKLVQSLYEQMGELLVDKATNCSSVSSRNLELLKDLIQNPLE